MLTLKLNEATTIVDEQKFVARSKAIIEANKGKAWVLPYILRLEQYAKIRAETTQQ